MLLQQQCIPVKIYVTHIWHFPELHFLEFDQREASFLFKSIQKVSKN